MLKIVGICLVMAGCIGSGWYLSGKALRRIHLLEEWESLLQLLYGEVDYAGRDLPDLIRRMIDQSHESRNFWMGIDGQLKQGNAGRIAVIWRRELQKKEWQILQQPERRILEELGEIIGQTDRQTQLHAIRLYQGCFKPGQRLLSGTGKGISCGRHYGGKFSGDLIIMIFKP